MFRSGKGYIAGRDIAFPIVLLTLSLALRRQSQIGSPIEAGDTSGVSYATHTSIRPRGEGTLTTFIPI